MSSENGIVRGAVGASTPTCILGLVLLLLLTATNALSRDVTFLWAENPENVDGYKIYYKTGSSGAPYNGTGATEGASPVTTGAVTTYTLHGLSDTETYYFALTAFAGGVESGYSTELKLDPLPPQTTGRNVTFVWTANTEAVDGYKLYYKTGSSGPPYNGTGIDEGASPIDTGNVTTYTLHGLSTTDTYYFALTAYSGSAESGYSEEIILAPAQVNSPPTAQNATISATEDEQFSGLLNASDPDGDVLIYTLVSDGSRGSASITNNTTGAFTYTPFANMNGSDSFTFRVNDGTVDSAIATVSVNIAPVNDRPSVTGSSVSTAEDTVFDGQLSGSDADEDALTYSIVTNGAKGTATITNSTTGAFRYVPNANATGSDAFTFRAGDGTLNSTAATVNITISPVNDAPVATGASFDVQEDTVRSGQLSATDADGDTLTFSIVSNPTKGEVVITNTATGYFSYTPQSNATGSDSFAFRVSDGTENSAPATVNLSISSVNDAPVADGASLATNEDTVYTGQLGGSDPDGDTIAFSIVNAASKGLVEITNPASGAFRYTPNSNESGSDSFTFRVGDGTLYSSAATVTISITAVNDVPEASGQSIATARNTAYSGQLSGSDVDGDTLTYSIVSNAGKGTAVITDSSSGAFTYTPNTNASGSDSFTFRVNDGTVNSATATVNVTITADNTPPVAGDITISTEINTEASGQLPGSDADGDTLTYSIVSGATKGTAEITNAQTGAFRYTPGTDESGSDTFTYKVNDGEVDSAVGTVSVTIVDETEITAIFGDNYSSDYAGTVTDTYTNVNTDNYSSLEVLRTYAVSTKPPHKPANTIVMKVNLDAIPSYATVVEANLILHLSEASGAEQYVNSVHKITGKNPVVGEVTGYNASGAEAWTPVTPGATFRDVPLGVADIAAKEDEQVIGTQPGYVTWSITQMVQDWIASPSTNFGLLIMGENAEEVGRGFASSENVNAAIRPQVVVRYVAVPRAPRLIIIEEMK